jgi:hypothetical protein
MPSSHHHMVQIFPPLKTLFHGMMATKTDVHVNVMMLSKTDNMNDRLHSDLLNAPRALIADWLRQLASGRGRNVNKS